MVRRYNRLLVAFHVVTDALLGMAAFVLAYLLRFETGLIPITKGYPPLEQYLNVLPFVALLVPLGFQLQGLYRLRRGRSRVDDFFTVLVGSILAVVFGIVAHAVLPGLLRRPTREGDAAPTRSRSSSGRIFLVLNVVLGYLSRELVRELLERRWRAGHRPASAS